VHTCMRGKTHAWMHPYVCISIIFLQCIGKLVVACACASLCSKHVLACPHMPKLTLYTTNPLALFTSSCFHRTQDLTFRILLLIDMTPEIDSSRLWSVLRTVRSCSKTKLLSEVSMISRPISTTQDTEHKHLVSKHACRVRHDLAFAQANTPTPLDASA